MRRSNFSVLIPKEGGLTLGLFISFDNFSNTKALKKELRSSRLIDDISFKLVIVTYISELEAGNRLSVAIRLVVGVVTQTQTVAR